MIGEMNLKPEEVFLAQGTLRPDLIESASHLASGKAEVIKTHHNDTELIRKLRDEVSSRFHWFWLIGDDLMEGLGTSLFVGLLFLVTFSTFCFELKLKDDDAFGLVRLKPPVKEKSSCFFFWCALF